MSTTKHLLLLALIGAVTTDAFVLYGETVDASGVDNVSTTESAPVPTTATGTTDSQPTLPNKPAVVSGKSSFLESELERRLPFLKGVGAEGRKEFFAIVYNQTYTKADVWKAVEEWASLQGPQTQEAVEVFYKSVETHMHNSRARVDSIVEKLPQALKKLSKIIQDVNVTRVEEREKIDALFGTLDSDTSKTLRFVLDLVSFRKNELKPESSTKKVELKLLKKLKTKKSPAPNSP